MSDLLVCGPIPDELPVPNEILLMILSYLPAKEQGKCAGVSQRWRGAVDVLTRRHLLWRNRVESDFPCQFQRTKFQTEVEWFHIYRSLSRWRLLARVNQRRREFAYESNKLKEIVDVKVLTNGTIGVHNKQGVVFYDTDSLKPVERPKIKGNYRKYTEVSPDIIIVLWSCVLHVVRRSIGDPEYESESSFFDCQDFVVHDMNLYYVTHQTPQTVLTIKLNENKLVAAYFASPSQNCRVVGLGYTTQLNLLTHRGLFFVRNEKINYSTYWDEGTEFFTLLKKYDLVNGFPIFKNNAVVTSPMIGPQTRNRKKVRVAERKLLSTVDIIRSHGDMIFIGNKCGSLLIYYSPDDKLDMLNRKPLLTYHLGHIVCPGMRNDPPLSEADADNHNVCTIRQIAVMDGKDEISVFVAMKCKILVLNFLFSKPAECPLTAVDIPSPIDWRYREARAQEMRDAVAVAAAAAETEAGAASQGQRGKRRACAALSAPTRKRAH